MASSTLLGDDPTSSIFIDGETVQYATVGVVTPQYAKLDIDGLTERQNISLSVDQGTGKPLPDQEKAGYRVLGIGDRAVYRVQFSLI